MGGGNRSSRYPRARVPARIDWMGRASGPLASMLSGPTNPGWPSTRQVGAARGNEPVRHRGGQAGSTASRPCRLRPRVMRSGDACGRAGPGKTIHPEVGRPAQRAGSRGMAVVGDPRGGVPAGGADGGWRADGGVGSGNVCSQVSVEAARGGSPKAVEASPPVLKELPIAELARMGWRSEQVCACERSFDASGDSCVFLHWQRRRALPSR